MRFFSFVSEVSITVVNNLYRLDSANLRHRGKEGDAGKNGNQDRVLDCNARYEDQHLEVEDKLAGNHLTKGYDEQIVCRSDEVIISEA